MDKSFLQEILGSLRNHPMVAALFGDKQDVPKKSAATPGQHLEIAYDTSHATPYAPVNAIVEPGDEGGFRARMLGVVLRPEGKRFYEGQGQSESSDKALGLAEMQMQTKIGSAPADSIPVRQAYRDYVGDKAEHEQFKEAIKRLLIAPGFIFPNKI